MEEIVSAVAQGFRAEQAARRFLEAQGLTLVTQNYRSHCGEIDLIMRDKIHLVFVEVRLRKNADYGESVETISPRKRQRIIRTALYYLQAKKLLEKEYCRFDVIGVNRDPLSGEENFWWLQNAFGVDY